MGSRSKSEELFVEASRIQDAKRDMAAWACRWQEVRERVLAEPKETLEEALQARLPAELEVRVHEERPDLHYFVVPAWPAVQAADELVQSIVDMVARRVLHSESPVPSTDRGLPETGVVSVDPETRIVARAWRDPDFLDRLRDDTARAFSEAVGCTWPESVQLRLLEESTGLLHVVIPSECCPAEKALAAGALDGPGRPPSERASGTTAPPAARS